MKKKRVLATGSSSSISEVVGKYENMAAANDAWDLHYDMQLQNQCQRRNGTMEEATISTASEISELFAELETTTQHGFAHAAMAVAARG